MDVDKDTGPLKSQLARIQESVNSIEAELKASGVAAFAIERARLVALLVAVDAPLRQARDYLSDAEVVVAITDNAGYSTGQAGGALVEKIKTAIEQLRADEQARGGTFDPSLFNLDDLGKRVWQSRVDYCLETGETAGGLTPWEDLDEWTRESCRRAGEDLVMYALERVGYKRPTTAYDLGDTGKHEAVKRE